MTGSTRAAAKFRGTAVDFVVDVRSHIEYWLGHLPGAVCIPVTKLPEGMHKLDRLMQSSRILVYCASGNRSASAAAQLKAAGFRNVVDGGGMSAAGEHFTAATA